MSRLITASLVGSIEWLQKCPTSWKERSYKDLVNMLSRIWTTPSAAVKRGMDFESNVNKVLNHNLDEDSKLSPNFRKILEICKGGKQQTKSKSFIEIDGVEYCLYGKMDYDFTPDRIVDLKTTQKYKGRDYYLNTIQHIIYCYNEKCQKFKYLVAEFAGQSNKITDVFEIDFFIENPTELKKILIDRIQNAITFLKSDPELWDLYNHKFCLY